MDLEHNPSYQHFAAIDWCQDLINDPNYRVALHKAPPETPEDAGELMGKTFQTEATIRDKLSAYKVHDGQLSEVVVLFDIGIGMNGLPGVVHGGILALFLDQACCTFVSGFCASGVHTLKIHDENHCATLWPDITVATLYLNVTYHKFVKTPCVIAVRTKLKERNGRKVLVECQMEDARKNVLSKAEALCLLPRQTKM